MSEHKFEFELGLQEGDVIRFNDVWWEVTDVELHMGKKEMWLDPLNSAGEFMVMEKEEMEKRVAFSGEVRIIKKSYREALL